MKNLNILNILNITVGLLIVCAFGSAGADYKTDTESWRTEQEKRLRSESSWLSVVGLAWLKKGEQSLGSGSENKVKLPPSAPETLGIATLKNNKVSLKITFPDGVTIDKVAAEKNKTYDLVPDTEGTATEVKVGTVTFFAIKRKNGYGIRIKDSASIARASFKGRQWYDVDPNLKVEAKWVAYPKVKKLVVPDILGNENLEDSPGYAEFEFKGKKHKLTPTTEDNELFFVFCDQSCGQESYGAARFLYAEAPKDGKVVLDFNKTTNPPCAFTDFATCPLPPKGNRLSAAILAGEKKPLDGHH